MASQSFHFRKTTLASSSGERSRSRLLKELASSFRKSIASGHDEPFSPHVRREVSERVRFRVTAAEDMNEHFEVLTVPGPERHTGDVRCVEEVPHGAHRFPVERGSAIRAMRTDDVPRFTPPWRAVPSGQLSERARGLRRQRASRATRTHERDLGGSRRVTVADVGGAAAVLRTHDDQTALPCSP